MDIVANTFEAGMKITCDWKADKEIVMNACQSKANTINAGALEFMPNILPQALDLDSGNLQKKKRYEHIIFIVCCVRSPAVPAPAC